MDFILLHSLRSSFVYRLSFSPTDKDNDDGAVSMSSSMIDQIHQLLLERNARETIPFVSIIQRNATLLNQVDALQLKCAALERQGGGSIEPNETTLRNETRLRDKLEKVQEELNEKLTLHQKDTAQALETSHALTKSKDAQASLNKQIKNLEQEMALRDKQLGHMQDQLDESKSRTKLAEQQYVGLKETIRSLQSENDLLQQDNKNMVTRIVGEKEKASDEMNKLTEMVEKLKKEVDMLRTLKLQDDQRKSWFGSTKASPSSNNASASATKTNKFGSKSSTVPSLAKYTIDAHAGESVCVRYDSESDLVATCGSSEVKLWDTTNGTMKSLLRGGNVMTCCDIGGGLAVGGGTDKTCRVWNLATDRMIHQLVGHANKITCARLMGNAVLTASADRSLKVWDITRSTYKQSTTVRHSSTSYGLDVNDSFSAITGHLDGGIRVWDLRTGQKSGEIKEGDESTVTSVAFHPSKATEVLTCSQDHVIRIWDLRKGQVLQKFSDKEFRSGSFSSSATFSPDGKFIGSVSSESGNLFVWRLADSKMKKLTGHGVGASGFAWGRGGTCGQEVASVDNNGKLILWA